YKISGRRIRKHGCGCNSRRSFSHKCSLAWPAGIWLCSKSGLPDADDSRSVIVTTLKGDYASWLDADYAGNPARRAASQGCPGRRLQVLYDRLLDGWLIRR